MKVVVSVVVGIWLALGAAASQHPPPQAMHHACLDQEHQAIQRGEGFGMALPADRHGFPGPRHILDMGDSLGLTPAQKEETERLFDRMQTQALAVGQRLLAKEAEIEAAFASGAVDEAALRRLVEESAALRAELRWLHLSTHLKARALLTPEQRARYHALRYGSDHHVH